MGNTSRYGWGYPEVTDPPNLSLYVKNLAQAVETTVGGLDDAAAAAAIGGEWKDARTTPALAVGANKLQFSTNVVAPNGLTFNGTDTWTVVTTGLYSAFCQLRITANQNGGIVMGATAYSDATHYLPFLGFTGGPDYGLSGTVKLTAGQQFCFYFYDNGSATTINNALRNAMAKIWKVA